MAVGAVLAPAAVVALAGVITAAALAPATPLVVVPSAMGPADEVLAASTIDVSDVPGAVGAAPERNFGLDQPTIALCDAERVPSETTRSSRVQSFFTVAALNSASEEVVAYRDEVAAMRALVDAEHTKQACQGHRDTEGDVRATLDIDLVSPPAGAMDGSVAYLVHGTYAPFSTVTVAFHPRAQSESVELWTSVVYQRRGPVLAGVYASGPSRAKVLAVTAAMAPAAARGLDRLPTVQP